MKHCRVNDIYDIVAADNVADWDAINSWERERISHTIAHLDKGQVLYDIGVEHGWISAIYAKYAEVDMVLVEPSPEFWPNIARTWMDNGLRHPIACFPGFAGAVDTTDVNAYPLAWWPRQIAGPECPAMAYRYLHNDHHITQDIPVVTIDSLVTWTGFRPDGITIDIEGAELGALLGAGHTLERVRPKVWVSVHPDLMERDYGTTPAQLLEYMTTFDYNHKLLAVDHEHHYYFEPQ